jgi:glycosyltransferase involved in cell wall biosynthesis
MRSTLIITYNYPPRGGGGVQRTVKFAKYLPEFGWQPTIICPDWGSGVGRKNSDETLTEEISHAEVILAGLPAPDGKTGVWKFLAQTPRAGRWVPALKANLQYPDFARRWIKDAVDAGRQLLKERSFDVLYSTSPPVTAHVAAMKLKREFGVPWVADFRDPWTDNWMAYRRIWRIRKRIDRALEQRVYDNAERIIANTHTNRQTLIEQHALASEKVVTIPNGYDECDFNGVESSRPASQFRITYCGSAYGPYTPEPFLEAFRTLLETQPNIRATFTIAGSACRWAENHVSDATTRSHLDLRGYLSHSEIPALLGTSHLLVQALPPGTSYWVPGKLYEYLRSGTPIIAICNCPSEVERILQETGRGVAFRHDDLGGVVEHLRESYDAWGEGRNQQLPTGDAGIWMYERRHLTACLAEVFQEVVGPIPCH